MLVYIPLAEKLGLEHWTELCIVLSNGYCKILWHIVYEFTAVLIFAWLGILEGDLALSLGGIVMFKLGWSDLLYYLIVLQVPPPNMPWLGDGWVGRLLGTSRLDLLVASGISLIFAVSILKSWHMMER